MRRARDEEFRRMASRSSARGRGGRRESRRGGGGGGGGAKATEAKAKEPGRGKRNGTRLFRGAGRRAPGPRRRREENILQNPPSAASLPPRRRLERSLVTPATSPAGPSSSVRASGGKTGGGDDGEPSYSPEPPSDDEDAAARVAALRERLSEAARKLHRAEQLAAGFAFGSQGRGENDADARTAESAFGALRRRLAGLAAAVDAAGSTAAADPITRERRSARTHAPSRRGSRTCRRSSRRASGLASRPYGKDWPTAAPMTDGRFGAARGKAGRAADALGGGVAEPIGTLGNHSSIVER